MAFIAGFSIGLNILAIDCFCQNSCTGSFAHTSRTAKEERMRELLVLYGVL